MKKYSINQLSTSRTSRRTTPALRPSRIETATAAALLAACSLGASADSLTVDFVNNWTRNTTGVTGDITVNQYVAAWGDGGEWGEKNVVVGAETGTGTVVVKGEGGLGSINSSAGGTVTVHGGSITFQKQVSASGSTLSLGDSSTTRTTFEGNLFSKSDGGQDPSVTVLGRQIQMKEIYQTGGVTAIGGKETDSVNTGHISVSQSELHIGSAGGRVRSLTVSGDVLLQDDLKYIGAAGSSNASFQSSGDIGLQGRVYLNGINTNLEASSESGAITVKYGVNAESNSLSLNRKKGLSLDAYKGIEVDSLMQVYGDGVYSFKTRSTAEGEGDITFNTPFTLQNDRRAGTAKVISDGSSASPLSAIDSVRQDFGLDADQAEALIEASGDVRFGSSDSDYTPYALYARQNAFYYVSGNNITLNGSLFAENTSTRARTDHLGIYMKAAGDVSIKSKHSRDAGLYSYGANRVEIGAGANISLDGSVFTESSGYDDRDNTLLLKAGGNVTVTPTRDSAFYAHSRGSGTIEAGGDIRFVKGSYRDSIFIQGAENDSGRTQYGYSLTLKGRNISAGDVDVQAHAALSVQASGDVSFNSLLLDTDSSPLEGFEENAITLTGEGSTFALSGRTSGYSDNTHSLEVRQNKGLTVTADNILISQGIAVNEAGGLALNARRSLTVSRSENERNIDSSGRFQNSAAIHWINGSGDRDGRPVFGSSGAEVTINGRVVFNDFSRDGASTITFDGSRITLNSNGDADAIENQSAADHSDFASHSDPNYYAAILVDSTAQPQEDRLQIGHAASCSGGSAAAATESIAINGGIILLNPLSVSIDAKNILVNGWNNDFYSTERYEGSWWKYNTTLTDATGQSTVRIGSDDTDRLRFIGAITKQSSGYNYGSSRRSSYALFGKNIEVLNAGLMAVFANDHYGDIRIGSEEATADTLIRGSIVNNYASGIGIDIHGGRIAIVDTSATTRLPMDNSRYNTTTDYNGESQGLVNGEVPHDAIVIGVADTAGSHAVIGDEGSAVTIEGRVLLKRGEANTGTGLEIKGSTIAIYDADASIYGTEAAAGKLSGNERLRKNENVVVNAATDLLIGTDSTREVEIYGGVIGWEGNPGNQRTIIRGSQVLIDAASGKTALEAQPGAALSVGLERGSGGAAATTTTLINGEVWAHGWNRRSGEVAENTRIELKGTQIAVDSNGRSYAAYASEAGTIRIGSESTGLFQAQGEIKAAYESPRRLSDVRDTAVTVNAKEIGVAAGSTGYSVEALNRGAVSLGTASTEKITALGEMRAGADHGAYSDYESSITALAGGEIAVSALAESDHPDYAAEALPYGRIALGDESTRKFYAQGELKAGAFVVSSGIYGSTGSASIAANGTETMQLATTTTGYAAEALNSARITLGSDSAQEFKAKGEIKADNPLHINQGSLVSVNAKNVFIETDKTHYAAEALNASTVTLGAGGENSTLCARGELKAENGSTLTGRGDTIALFTDETHFAAEALTGSSVEFGSDTSSLFYAKGGLKAENQGFLRAAAKTVSIEAGSSGLAAEALKGSAVTLGARDAEALGARGELKAEGGAIIASGKQAVLEAGSTGYAARALSGGTIRVGAEGTRSVIRGGLMSDLSSSVALFAEGSGSLIEGRAYDEGAVTRTEGAGSGLDITLKDGAVWRPEGGSSVRTLISHNAVVTLANGRIGDTLTIGHWKDDPTVLALDVDYGSNTGNDIVYVRNEHTGTTAVELSRGAGPSHYTAAMEGTVLARLGTESGSFTLANPRQQTDLYVYRLTLDERASTDPSYGTDVYLKTVSQSPRDDNGRYLPAPSSLMGVAGTAYNLWRNDMDTLFRRLGDVHETVAPDGVHAAWARAKGARWGVGGAFKYSGDYTEFEGGVDFFTAKTEHGRHYAGAAISFMDGNSSYAAGRGDSFALGVGLYDTFVREDGQHLDLSLKFENIDTKYHYLSQGVRHSGDAGSLGWSIGAEYGWKLPVRPGWFVEPGVKVVASTLSGDSGRDTGGISMNFDRVNSLWLRAGLRAGYESDRVQFFAKAAWNRDWSGNGSVTMRSGGERLHLTEDYDAGWLEYGAGLTVKLQKNLQLYMDFDRGSGGNYERKWAWDAGLRWNF
ncbi:autotransporter outer membrane beta-barrel domain-containing protein [Mesosutterella sp. OilRF-GAM-744-9]|uniref:Autotransporter outer membrane beta-barrel domain-containing protein n=1 Tax=Mesosutterella porci TaxID=2915351 RepID=A0ABS9MPS6_9BURK|nr:autotransporter outer membrane beta-barrel domain-containing protein [Mesosutterella sp. oilRF-744-WT-GAM-9]MCG5030618.1 autotransporter outer membrane beta-barrel domain-containing protein [Mesosutterella sp. oilRF-744-WT-GAM-9]